MQKLLLKLKTFFKEKFMNNNIVRKMYKFQHITQLKDFIFLLNKYSIFDKQNILEIYGTPKLHGTNCSIVFYKDGTYQIQSRNNILNEHKDNMEFYKWMNSERIEYIKDKIKPYLEKYPMVIVYGEYAGKSIQKNMAISNMERFFAVFALRLVNMKEDYYTIPINNIDIWNDNLRIFNLFKTEHKIILTKEKIDNLSFVEEIDKEVKKYETQCIFAEKFGFKGVGEGIVWHYFIDNKAYFFKTKIDEFKTKAQKVNKDKTIDKIKEDKKLVEYCLNENRLQQGIEYLKENSIPISIENIKSFISYIVQDTLREEKIFLQDNAVSDKKINKLVGAEAANWYKRYLKKEGLL